MKFYLGLTDNTWFNYLSKISPEDVNFWQPNGKAGFALLQPGEPFLFKLKSPFHAIGGVGFFSSHTFLPINVAWDIFQNQNGCDSFSQFHKLITFYRSDKENTNPIIGCVILTNPIFFHKDDWINVEEYMSREKIMRGKRFDTDDALGNELWQKIDNVLQKYLRPSIKDTVDSQLLLSDTEWPGYGKSILQKVRMGQGAFRVLITDAYKRKCSITGEKTLPVLEAAHIKPYNEEGPHVISNGLLLRSDIHKLFDTGYITITKDYKVVVSNRIKEEFENGREYYKFHGGDLLYLPNRDVDKPRESFIDWHNSKFRG